jgi:hypothetical protein
MALVTEHANDRVPTAVMLLALLVITQHKVKIK